MFDKDYDYREAFAKFMKKAREKRKDDEAKFKELIEKRVNEMHKLKEKENKKEVSE